MKFAEDFEQLKAEVKKLKEAYTDSITKDFYTYNDLPFTRQHALKLEKENKLRIIRRDGRSYVLREDLEDYIRGEK